MIRILLAALIISGAFLGSSCWDRRDPEHLAYVIGTGFDVEEDGRFHVIAQLANPLVLGGELGATGGEDKAFWVVSASGYTPLDAMRNLAEGTSRELFWAHNRVVMFSEELARRGIAPVLDLFERQRQLRTIAHPAVVSGDLRTLMEA
ncbi:MAG: hypothetical protein R6U70_02005, partial [Bacillota bacterium]